jgi:hypothetical protein
MVAGCIIVRSFAAIDVSAKSLRRPQLGAAIKPAAKPKPGRDLNVACFIDLMLPISFKPLLKYLRRCSLVNFGKLLEGKRVGHTQNIEINGL